MICLLRPTRRNWLAGNLFTASMFAFAFFASDAAQADCSSERSTCRSDCSLNPFSGPSLLGGMSGGAVGGMALGSCHSDCDAKYKECLISANTPQGRAAARREEEANKTISKWRDEQARQWQADAEKADAAFEALQRQELRWMLAWYKEYGISGDMRWPSASNLKADSDAVVQVEVPFRDYFPMRYTDEEPVLHEDLDPAGMKLNPHRYHVLKLLEPGTIVHINSFTNFGAVEISVGGDRRHTGEVTGQVISGALKPVSGK